MNKSRRVISDFNYIALSMPLKEDYFYSKDILFAAQNSINPASRTNCIFFQKLSNNNINGQDFAHENKSFCSEIRNALNPDEEVTLI